jgi:choline kinase
MSRPQRALILGAGQGSRLLPLTERMPKCLLDICGRSMLEWQLRGLSDAGVGEAVVVAKRVDEQGDVGLEFATRRIRTAGGRLGEADGA